MQNFLFTLLLYLFSTIFLNIEYQRQSKKSTNLVQTKPKYWPNQGRTFEPKLRTSGQNIIG